MSLEQKNWRLRISLTGSYLFVVLLAPWFHLHPAEDHEYTSGDSYHSHAEVFHTHSSEEDKDEKHDNSSPNHFTQIYNAVTNVVLSHPKSSWNTQPQSDHECIQLNNTLPKISSCCVLFESIIPSQRLEWYVQFATNLSPPLS